MIDIEAWLLLFCINMAERIYWSNNKRPTEEKINQTLFLNAENKVSKFQKNSIQCLLCDFLGSRKEKATGILTLCLLSGKCPKISQRWRQRTGWKSYLPSPEHIPFTFEPREIFKKDLHSQLCADFSLWTTTLFSSARIDKIQRCQYKLNSNNIKNKITIIIV